MRRALLVLVGLGAGFGLGSGPNSPVRIAFEPAPGARVSRELIGSLEITLEDIALRSGGGDWLDLGPLILPEADGSAEIGGALRTLDTYVESANGHPIVLEREYELIESSWGLGLRWDSYRALHPLTFRTVRFERAPDGGYRASWVPARKGDREVLAALSEDLDYRALLPTDPVEVGDWWTVPWTELGPVLLPGGRIHQNVALWEDLGLDALETGVEGRLSYAPNHLQAICELESVQPGTPPIASIRLLFEYDEPVEFTVEPEPAWLGIEEVELSFDVDLRAVGQLEWDLSAGRIAAFTLDTRFEIDGRVLAFVGHDFIEVRVDAAGHSTWDVAVSASR